MVENVEAMNHNSLGETCSYSAGKTVALSSVFDLLERKPSSDSEVPFEVTKAAVSTKKVEVDGDSPCDY